MIDDIRNALCDMGFEGSVMFDNPDYDDAVIGVTDEGNVVYDYNKMIESLVRNDGMEEIDAVEFIDYNTLRALPYSSDPRPIIVYPLMM